MLEIIVLIILARKIGALAESKGLKPGPWKLRLVLFWILGEFSGVFIGMAIFGRENIFPILLVAIGVAASSYFIIDNYLSKLPDTINDDIDNIGR